MEIIRETLHERGAISHSSQRLVIREGHASQTLSYPVTIFN